MKSFETFLLTLMCMKFWGVWTSEDLLKCHKQCNLPIWTLQRFSNTEPHKGLPMRREWNLIYKGRILNRQWIIFMEIWHLSWTIMQFQSQKWTISFEITIQTNSKEESGTYIFYISNYLDKCYYFPLKCFSIQIQMVCMWIINESRTLLQYSVAVVF